MEFSISSWIQDDGLPQNSVNAIIQTRDRYLWLATFGGLVRFDGVTFTQYNRFNSPGMLSDRVLNLYEDKQNKLWIGTEQGLVCYDQGAGKRAGLFKTYTMEHGLKNNIVIFATQDSKGNIWVVTAGNIFHKMVNDNFEQQLPTDSESLKIRAAKGEGEYLYYDDKYIIWLVDGKLTRYINIGDFTTESLWDVKEDRNHNLFIATNGDGIFILDPRRPEKIQSLNTSNGLLSDYVRKIMFDNSGNLWAVGSGGINRIDLTDRFRIYNAVSKEQIKGAVFCVLQDNEENYWFGTETEGLFMLEKAIIKTYGEKHGIKNEILLSLFNKKDGTLLVATNCGGIYEFNNGTAEFSYLNKYLINTCVWSIIEDSRNRIWIGAQDLISVEGKKATYYSKKDGFNGLSIFAIYEDRNGMIWVGTGEGLFKYNNDKFIQYTKKDGLTANEIRSIYQDKKGNLWIGTINGLNLMRDGKIIGYPVIADAQSNYIRAIHEDEDGVMWFGSYGGGLIRFKNNQFTVFTTKDGLFDNIVSHIVEDQFGYFWMGCNRGISRVSRNMLNKYAEGETEFLGVMSYGKQDGMESAETNGGFQPHAVLNNKGMIYFPTVKGLVEINPADVKENIYIPPVFIEKFIISGKERPEFLLHGNDDSFKIIKQIPYDSSDIQIEYTALRFSDSKNVKFKYMLEGFDEDWNDAGTIRFANYRRLPPGEYIFRVIARNKAGMWNQEAASLAFMVVPPFWMTWWFQSMVLMLFIAVGPIIYLNRISKLKKEQLRQQDFSRQLIESQETERKRIAVELHDGLGQNLLIIKSKLGSGLNSMENGQASVKIKEAEEFVVKSIQEVRYISKNLSPHLLDQLGLTSAIETMIENVEESSGIEFNFSSDNIDKLFDEKTEVSIYRIVQESINNIIKHSGAKKVEIKISNSADETILSVKDDGKGFDREKESIKRGFGLAGIKERASILGGKLILNSELNKGTELKVIFPADKRL
ncbi:MAG: two-component regulator propeller domain-containing protein [Ignavibacteriaceae bacterium]